MGQIVKLYHGTDARMVSMSKDERNDFLDRTDLLVSRLWDVFKPYYDEYVPRKFVRNGKVIETYMRAIEQYKGRFEELGKVNVYYNMMEKLSMLEARYNGSNLFQYKSLYLAATEGTAQSYALRSFAGGELGLIAYRLLEAMDVLQFPEWKPDKETISSIIRLREFSAEENKDPVVITIEGIDSDNLLLENGGDAAIFLDFLNKFDIVPDYKFKYLGDLDLSSFPMEHLKKV